MKFSTASTILSLTFGFQGAWALPGFRASVSDIVDSDAPAKNANNGLALHESGHVASGLGCPGTDTTVSVTHERVHFVKGRANDDSQPSEGDLTVWQGADLTNDANDVIGKSTGTCIQVSDDFVTYYNVMYGKYINCFLTLTFDGDDNYGAGSLMIQGEYDAGSSGSVMAVTGGTGAYKAATGQATLSNDGNWDYALDVSC